MATVSVTRTYDEPTEKIWDILANIGEVSEIHPNIVESSRLNKKQGLGAKRMCDFGKGKGVDEEVTVWHKHKELAFTATSFRGLPMKHMIGSFQFESESPTTVTFTMDYAMKGGFLMDLMARKMMREAGSGMLDGLRSKL